MLEKAFDDFEKSVMEELLEGNGDTLKTLRKQYEISTVKSREFTGVGFFTTFGVPENVPYLESSKSFQFGDVVGQIEGILNGVGFVLYVKDGRIHMLEGYTYGSEKWPEKITNYKLSHIPSLKRDIEDLK